MPNKDGTGRLGRGKNCNSKAKRDRLKKRKTIWEIVPKTYKSIIKGKKYVLARSSKGTVLVPINSNLAKKTWGKYLKK